MTAIAERVNERATEPTLGRAGSSLIAVLAVALSGWAGALAASHHRPGLATGAVLVAVWALAGYTLARREGCAPLGRLVLIATLLVAAAGLGTAERASATRLSELARAVLEGLVPAAGLHVLLSMPPGRLATPWRRGLAVAGYAAGAAVALFAWSQRPGIPLWPLAIQIPLTLVIGFGAVAMRMKRANGIEQRRVKWLGWGIVVVAGIAAAGFALHALVDRPPHVVEIAACATVLIPIALALSTSERLSPAIDRLLAQTVALAGLVALVSAVYLAIVLGLGRVPAPKERNLLVLSMISAGLVALLYVPTRARLARFANRLVYGEHNAPDDVIRTFGSRLSRAVPMDELLLQMAESLRKTLLLDAVEVWTGSGGRFERIVSDPDRGSARITLNASEEPIVARAGVSGPAWMKVWLPRMIEDRESPHIRIAPVTHSGELLGLILIERKADGRPLTQDDERTLTELARQVGLALHNVQLDSALQASLDEVRRQAAALQLSRGRIVAAADAERRRIERNLHDGAQQHLVALAVKVRLARQLAEMDADQSKKILEELGGDVQDALQELRDLAHGIYPPLLADRGLGEALVAAAGRSPVPTTVTTEGIVRYTPEIEAAVYFCCLEALQNAGKYAGEGATATVRVWTEAGALLFDVIDTGAGFDASNRKMGAGFTNMSDRLGAIGGTLRVESAPGRGTKVGGTIPLPV